MSNSPENELDLEKLFLPSWAQEPSSTKSYANYEVREDRPDRREFRGPRPPRREGPPRGPRPDRPPGEARGPRPGFGGGRPPRPGGDRGPRPGGRREGRPGFEGRRPERMEEPPKPLPELTVTLSPEEKGVESLARQIKMTGRAYPLFDIAQLILQRPERHMVNFQIKKTPEGQPVQPLVLCLLDDTLWLSEDEAIAHVLNKHFATFYQAEKTATEPPKGKYTFVAQCGISGVILGPPNHHDYQAHLRRLHAERFSRMPFEVFKSRVRIVRDEEVVKKWVEEQSWRTEYLCLNLPEPVRLDNLEAVQKHFREVHKDTIIKTVEAHRLAGTAARSLRSPDLVRLVRKVVDEQRRFPLQIATVLSQQFAQHGLHFFKVNKTITHVSVSRPHYLDLETFPVSENVRRIVQYINEHPRCTRRKLVEALAPAPAAPVQLPPPPAAAPLTPPVAPVPGGAVPPAEAQSGEAAAAPAPAAEPAAAQPAAPAKPAAPEPTPEQNALIGDLHWLIHQGHVIEFANGTLEAAKKPAPKPPKPAKPEPQPKAEAAATAPAAEAPATETPAPDGSAAPAAENESPAAPPETAAHQEVQATPPVPEAAVQLSDGTVPSENTALEVPEPGQTTPPNQEPPAPPAALDPEKQA